MATHKPNPRAGRRVRQRGFTLLELMISVIIVIVMTVAAYPSLKTFISRDEATSAGTFVTRLVNRLKFQARQRNRAYVVVFSQFSDTMPQGQISVLEGSGPSCRTVSQAPVNERRVLQTYGLGEDPIENPEWQKPVNVGLLDTVPAGVSAGDDSVSLCLSPAGAMFNFATLAPFVGAGQGDRGALTVRFQRFEGDGGGGWRIAGPPRSLIFPFAGPARLGLGI